MAKLPVIVASGGVNTAGRTSHRHAHNRLVFDALGRLEQQKTLAALASMMDASEDDDVLAGTLVRKIGRDYFDPAAIPTNLRFLVDDVHGVVNLSPDGFATSRSTDSLRGLSSGETILVASERPFEVSVAGQLPAGFDPAALYTSRNHPRGLQMSIFAMSDALADLGIDWDQLTANLAPDAVSVYVSSSMGQLDDAATGGMLTASLRGERVTSKHCP
ncbi:MAG: beta-ketoacyl synthase, partial [Luminiphilus sp.]|nr:beta-ketoacyl synthase [Luminiphilus sp.]